MCWVIDLEIPCLQLKIMWIIFPTYLSSRRFSFFCSTIGYHDEDRTSTCIWEEQILMRLHILLLSNLYVLIKLLLQVFFGKKCLTLDGSLSRIKLCFIIGYKSTSWLSYGNLYWKYKQYWYDFKLLQAVKEIKTKH
jgi:hypothetical protein